MVRALLITLVLLAVPTTASAAPLGELPLQPAGGAAACLTPTGKPGELIRWTRGGVQLLEARADGLHATAGVPLGTYTACPAIAADAGGAAVLAAPLKSGVRVALREPGTATWSAPVTLPGIRTWEIAAAVSARGDALLAWLEGGEDDRVRIRGVRRVAGGTFGAVEELVPWSEGDGVDVGVEVGLSAAGEAIVVHTEPSDSQGDDEETVRALARIAPPGGAFGPPRALVTTRSRTTPALAVAPDGRALVALGGFNDLQLYERAPGGEFAPLQTLEVGALFGRLALAMQANGAAVVAWRQGDYDPIRAIVRGGPGPFNPPLLAAEAPKPLRNTSISSFYLLTGTNPPPETDREVVASLGPDGRALLAWSTPEHGVGTVTLSGGVASGQTLLGSPLRPSAGLSPLALADGSPALAWTDDRGLHDREPADGRLHLALEGTTPSPEPVAPRVTVRAPARRALRPAQTLVLPVHCSAACDVRAIVPGSPPESDATGSRASAGVVRLRISPLLTRPLVPRRGKLRLTLRTSAPGARTVQRQTVSLALRRLPAPRIPRILGARARRDGSDVVVRWRTDGPVRDAYFAVAGQRGPGRESEVVTTGAPKRLAGRSFSVRLENAARARYVRILLSPLGPGAKGREVRIKVPLT